MDERTGSGVAAMERIEPEARTGFDRALEPETGVVDSSAGRPLWDDEGSLVWPPLDAESPAA